LQVGKQGWVRRQRARGVCRRPCELHPSLQSAAPTMFHPDIPPLAWPFAESHEQRTID
jgi:hypothetical protein